MMTPHPGCCRHGHNPPSLRRGMCVGDMEKDAGMDLLFGHVLTQWLMSRTYEWGCGMNLTVSHPPL